MQDLNDFGATIVLITHDPDVAAQADRQVHIRDGLIVLSEHHWSWSGWRWAGWVRAECARC